MIRTSVVLVVHFTVCFKYTSQTLLRWWYDSPFCRAFIKSEKCGDGDGDGDGLVFHTFYNEKNEAFLKNREIDEPWIFPLSTLIIFINYYYYLYYLIVAIIIVVMFCIFLSPGTEKKKLIVWDLPLAYTTVSQSNSHGDGDGLRCFHTLTK